MDEDELNGTLLRRVLEEVSLHVRWPKRHLLACLGRIDHEVEAGPPLQQQQRDRSLLVADLAPKKTHDEGLHPSLEASFEVQTLLLLFEIIHLEHCLLDYVVELWASQVKRAHFEAIDVVCGPESDQVCIDVHLADLHGQIGQYLLL